MTTIAALAGVVLGVVASLPMLYVLAASAQRRSPFGLARLLVCCVAPFLMLQAIMLVVYVNWRQVAAIFGIISAFSFLAIVVLAVMHTKPWE